MDEPQLGQKIQKVVPRVKKEATALKEDGLNKVSHVAENLDHPNEDMAARVQSGVGQLSSEFKRVTGDAKKTVAHVSTTLRKNVGSGLSVYNAKVTEVAKKIPGSVGSQAGKYPWVAISIALMVGFLLRGFLMPRLN